MKHYIVESLKYIFRSKVFIKPYLNQINSLYLLKDEELRSAIEKRFLEIFKLAITESPYYKELYSQKNIKVEDINSLEDIDKLPIIDKTTIARFSKELAVKPTYKLRAETTSGTTGTPRVIYRDFPSVWREQAYYYDYWKKRGFIYGKDRCISLRGNLDRTKKHLKIHVSKTLFLSSYHINEEEVDFFYNSIRGYKPIAIFGYPSSLYNLACILKDKGLSLDIPKSFTSSETVTDKIRTTIEEVFNTELYDNYGGAERTICLMECIDHRGYFSPPGYSINEFKDDHIITTALINKAYPLIRYKVEDIITLADKPTKKDNELCIVDSIDGRSDDFILAKDGTKITFLSDFLFEEAKNLRNAQIIQNEAGCVQINLVLNDPKEGFEKDKFIKIINERVGVDNLDFSFAIIDDSDIIYTKRNKFRQVVSNLQ